MNWGYKLTITFVVFIGGMGYLVYRAMGTNFELVEKEYYKKELNYQAVIEATENAKGLAQPVQLLKEDDSIVVVIPGNKAEQTVSGQIWFYCSYDATRDRKFEMKMDEHGRQLIPLNQLKPGNYAVKMEWQADGENYYTVIPFEI